MAKILIVEDDDSVRTLAARALQRNGYEIEVAVDGGSGLDCIRAAEGGYDLVVSDVRMPGMDGIEMARAAAASYPALKLMLMTGYADQRERCESLRGVVRDVLQKPFSLADLRERVEHLLAEAVEPAA